MVQAQCRSERFLSIVNLLHCNISKGISSVVLLLLLLLLFNYHLLSLVLRIARYIMLFSLVFVTLVLVLVWIPSGVYSYRFQMSPSKVARKTSNAVNIRTRLYDTNNGTTIITYIIHYHHY